MDASDLRGIASRYSSHGGKVSDRWLSYVDAYDAWFLSYREKPIRLLEIGVEGGGTSLGIWNSYFRNAIAIVGCNIADSLSSLKYDDPKIKVVFGDPSGKRTETRIKAASGLFDVVVDNGVHASGTILKAFSKYFPLLRHGGIYVIADLDAGEEKDGERHDRASAAVFLHALADTLEHRQRGSESDRRRASADFKKRYGFELTDRLLDEIRSIEFSGALCKISKTDREGGALGERAAPEIGAEAGAHEGDRHRTSPAEVNAATPRANPVEPEAQVGISNDDRIKLRAALAEHHGARGFREASVPAPESNASEANDEIERLRAELLAADGAVKQLLLDVRLKVPDEARPAGRLAGGDYESVGDLRRARKQRERELNELRSYVLFLRRQLDFEAEEANAQIAERDRQIAHLSADHTGAWKRVEEAHQYNSAITERLNAAEAEVERLRRGVLWRVAAPLRAAGRAFVRAQIRFGKPLSLYPSHQIQSLSSNGDIAEWTMLGTDPNFELNWSPPEPLPPGHYILAIDAPEGLAEFRMPKLYVDSGRGYNEAEAPVLAPFGRRSDKFRAIFSLIGGARALRFDPSEHPGRLVTGKSRLRRMPRAEYYARVAHRLALAQFSRDRSLRPALARAMEIFKGGGLGALARHLRLAAQRFGEMDARNQADRARHLVIDHPRYVPITTDAPVAAPAVKLICFYLPQFHPIPENNEWWGEGFTEWTNVRPARPQFEGHYQPHEPDVLGYYDLRDSEVQRKQVELAKLYGIGGFCFYFYWFAGKRLLETPTETYLADASLDLPFCLCWANENWSRRWDGRESELLMSQQHSPADDIAFIAHIAKYLRDPRYIRVDGKPMVLVYRPSLLPSAAATAARWRTWCRENGLGEIYLAYTQSFEKDNPAVFGFDAAVEFPPNNSSPPKLNDVTPNSPAFTGNVFDWTIFPERSRDYSEPSYPLFRSVCPAWDNTARRKTAGTIFANSTPALFGEWLDNAIADTKRRFRRRDEQLVFVNAWNEWAEGAHLEPDRRYGFAYLDAVRTSLKKASNDHLGRVVIVSHDAHPHGAQILALSMARAFGEMGFGVDLIVLGGGPLLGSFREVATVHQIDLARQPRDDVLKLLHALKAHGADVAIANTVVSGLMVPLLREADFHTLSLVHELPGILKSYKLEAHAEAIASHAEKVVFPAEIVRSGFEAFVGRDLGDIAVIRPQGSYLQSPHRFVEDLGPIRRRMREELGLAADSRIVMSSGYADHRKGVDLFVESLLQVMQSDDKVVGLWIGHRDEALFAEQMTRIRESGRQSRFVFTGRIGNPEDYYAAADVFALTSREDPFPSVVLEAFEVRLPVVAFEGAGGSESLLRRGCGVIVPAFDTTRFAEAIGGLIENPARGAKLAATGYDIVLREFGFRHYLFDLLELAGRPLPKVSVVVPNYNYARYMGARLDSIVKQRIPIYELIVLDDCSKDDSVNVIRSLLANCPVSAPFVANKENSGSVFRQWARGVELARGDLVWIAEADDLSDRAFLKEVLPAFARSDVVMSYSQSRAIDGDGGVAFENYLHYVADIDPEKWTKPYTVAGTEEIREALFVKNTIPNVSSVVFRREALQEVLRDHSKEILSYRNAGDWVVYLRLLEKGAIAFSPRALNLHRRHGGSVTVGNFNIRQLREIVRVQRETIERHGLGEDAQRAADAYAQKLYEQFGLATESSPRFDSHEGVMSDLRP